MITRARAQNKNETISRTSVLTFCALAIVLILFLAINHTKQATQTIVGPPIKLDVISNITLFTDDMVFIPIYFKEIMNKTFYNATNESVFIFNYYIKDNKLYILTLESPQVIYSTTTSVKYGMPSNYNASIHNHPAPYDMCRISDGDMETGLSIIGIYCKGPTILFYIRELNKLYYYNFTW